MDIYACSEAVGISERPKCLRSLAWILPWVLLSIGACAGDETVAQDSVLHLDDKRTAQFIMLEVVDSSGSPVPDAVVKFRGVAFRPGSHLAKKTVDWISLGIEKTNMTGESRFSIPISGITHVQAIAHNSKTGNLVGAVSIDLKYLHQENSIRLVLFPGEKWSGSLVDFDLLTPIVQGRLDLYVRAKVGVGWIDTGRSTTSACKVKNSRRLWLSICLINFGPATVLNGADWKLRCDLPEGNKQ